MGQNTGPMDVVVGRFTEDMDPGMAHTVEHVTQGLAATAAANAQSQAEARQFIQANGADVLGGHPSVNSPDGGPFVSHIGNQAPEYPPVLMVDMARPDVQSAAPSPDSPVEHLFDAGTD